MTSQPNPGSPEAVKLGCTRPSGLVLTSFARRKDLFWVDKWCPMHGKPMNKGKPK